jgi:hypothetical protein
VNVYTNRHKNAKISKDHSRQIRPFSDIYRDGGNKPRNISASCFVLTFTKTLIPSTSRASVCTVEYDTKVPQYFTSLSAPSRDHACSSCGHATIHKGPLSVSLIFLNDRLPCRTLFIKSDLFSLSLFSFFPALFTSRANICLFVVADSAWSL